MIKNNPNNLIKEKNITNSSNKEELLELRATFGKFVTGVTIITYSDGNEINGITVNSFCSLSLSPPLVSWNISQNTNSEKFFKNDSYCVVNILNSAQEKLANKFAISGDNKFNNVEYSLNNKNVPIISNCLAYIHCKIYNIIPCGDHLIIIGEVKKHHYNQKKPLIFSSGKYINIKD